MSDPIRMPPDAPSAYDAVPRDGVLVKILAVTLLVVAGALVFAVWQLRQRPAAQGVSAFEPRPVIPTPSAFGGDEKATIEVFRAESPSVVHITSLRTRRDRLSMDIAEIPQGTGSGFVWDTAGHIVTNYHVVKDGDRAQVTLAADGSSYAATIIGRAPDKDLAVLKIDAPPSKLRPIDLGSSNDLVVGQKVLAIGNPFGLDQSLTTGVISGLGREIKSVTNRAIFDVVQTDAPINPGNSGGPLLDSSGRLIGINTAIYSPSGANAGIGFAVPVDTINAIVPQLITSGRVTRPGLGVNLATDQLAAHLNIAGVLLMGVAPGGAAEAAGLVGSSSDADGRLVLGDVIVAVDTTTIAGSRDLFKVLDAHGVGDVIELTASRAGAERKVKVTLQAIPTADP